MQERGIPSLVDQMRSKTAKLNQTVASAFQEKQKEDDPRFWKPSYDENGIGYAVVRLLPQKNFDAEPDFHHGNHGFLMPNNQWYIQNCARPSGGKCPACDRLQWSDDDKALKDIYTKRKARRMWMVNVVVIQDKAKPENNGKVFLWNMTTMFHTAIMNAINGKTPEEVKFNPFDIFNGANLKIQIEVTGKGKNKNVKYACFWSDNIGPMSNKDEVLERVLSQVYDLGVIAKEKRYELKSYEELDKILSDGGMGGIVSSTKKEDEQTVDPVTNDIDDDLKTVNETVADKKQVQTKAAVKKGADEVSLDDDDDNFDFSMDEGITVDMDNLDLEDKPKTTKKAPAKTSDDDLDDLLKD